MKLFEIEFRQLLFLILLLVVWLSWNFVRFHKILFQTDAESFSSLSLKSVTNAEFAERPPQAYSRFGPLHCGHFSVPKVIFMQAPEFSD